MSSSDDKKGRSRSDPHLPGTIIRPPSSAAPRAGEEPTVLVPGGTFDLFRFLESRGLVSREQTQELEREVLLGSESLAERLVERGLAATAVAMALADYFGLKRASDPRFQPDAALLTRASPSLWRKARSLPLAKQGKTIEVVTSDPSLTVLHEQLEARLGGEIVASVLPVPTLAEALARTFGPKLIERRKDGSKHVEHVLRGSETSVGKSSDNDLRVDDPTVSRKHARLRCDDRGQWWLRDLGSANGTRVDRRQIREEIALASGMEVELGQTRFVFYDAEHESEDATTDHEPSRPLADSVKTAALPRQSPSPAPAAAEPTEASPMTGDEVAKPSAEQDAPPQAEETGDKEKGEKKKKKRKKKKSDSRMQAAWLRVIGQFVATLAAVIAPFLALKYFDVGSRSSPGSLAEPSQLFREAFPGQFEPSGLAPGGDGETLLFADDSRPGSLFRFELDPRGRLRGRTVEEQSFSSTTPAEDLEALTWNGEERILYALSSHGRDRSGQVPPSALLRIRETRRGFEVDAGIDDLRERLLRSYTILDAARDLPPEEGGINLEGMAWDPVRKRLLLGARSPLETTYRGQEALIFALLPARAADDFDLATAVLAPEPIFLDLGGSGIRGMEFDPEHGSFLLVSGGSRDSGHFGIWEWTGEARDRPRQIPSVSFPEDSKPEGIARAYPREGESVWIVVDDAGGYFLLTDDELGR